MAFEAFMSAIPNAEGQDTNERQAHPEEKSSKSLFTAHLDKID